MATSLRSSLRSLAVALLAGAVGVLAAACGQQPNTGSGGHTLTDNLTAYASCMRSHGLPAFPDPTPGSPQNAQSIGFSAGGQSFSFDLGGTGIHPGSQAFQSAQAACQGNLGFQHGAEPAATPAAAAQLKHSALKFAACMRQNGIPTFPDPTSVKPGAGRPPRGHGFLIIKGPAGGISFNLQGIDLQSAQFQSAYQKCKADFSQSSGGFGG